MGEDTQSQQTPQPPSGFDALAEQARVDARMQSPERSYTDEQAEALLSELSAYKINTSSARAKVTWASLARQIGIAESTLSELRSGRYRSEGRDGFLRKIDQFLSDDRVRSSQVRVGDFAQIGVTRLIYGTAQAAFRHNSIAVVIGPSGCGKTATARAIALDREGCTLIRIDESNGDARGVTRLLAEALRLQTKSNHRDRLAAIIEFVSKNRITVLIVDESQKLKPDGLEILRDIHDRSDPDNRRNIPIVLFGDQDFYKLIIRARNGERSPIKPQMCRRMYPVLDLAAQGVHDGDKAALFSAEDVLKILRNNRLRLVDNAGGKWLATLANTEGYGSLGFALAVLRMALDVTAKTPLSVGDLQRALGMLIGPRAVREADDQAGGLLLKVG